MTKAWTPIVIERDRVKVVAWPDDAKVLFSFQDTDKGLYVEDNIADFVLTPEEARNVARQLIEAAEDVERPVNE